MNLFAGAGSSSPIARLALGTVQFGVEYGIANAGRPSDVEVERVLDSAWDTGVDLLDTARLYGEAEALIGRSAHPWRIVTKTGKFGSETDARRATERLRQDLDTSLATLRRARVEGLMFHDADDLLGPVGEALWEAARQARDAGLVGRIGASVYDGDQIDALLARYPIELVQLPLNPLDHRLEEGGQLDRLTAAGVEIHARSIFLQGLLLQSPEDINPRFGPLRTAIAELATWCENQQSSRLAGIASLCLADQRISRFVVGVVSEAQLAEIADAFGAARASVASMFSSSAPLSREHLDPSRWPTLLSAAKDPVR